MVQADGEVEAVSIPAERQPTPPPAQGPWVLRVSSPHPRGSWGSEVVMGEPGFHLSVQWKLSGQRTLSPITGLQRALWGRGGHRREARGEAQ